MRWILAMCLLGCGGHPSFTKPVCEEGYEDCMSMCDAKCREFRAPGEVPVTSNLQIECDHCVDECRAAARRCEAP